MQIVSFTPAKRLVQRMAVEVCEPYRVRPEAELAAAAEEVKNRWVIRNQELWECEIAALQRVIAYKKWLIDDRPVVPIDNAHHGVRLTELRGDAIVTFAQQVGSNEARLYVTEDMRYPMYTQVFALRSHSGRILSRPVWAGARPIEENDVRAAVLGVSVDTHVQSKGQSGEGRTTPSYVSELADVLETHFGPLPE
ncbi:MAG: hypothetical protein WD467_02920 [Candidatus Saccharimonadales bacterium]